MLVVYQNVQKKFFILLSECVRVLFLNYTLVHCYLLSRNNEVSLPPCEALYLPA